MKPTKEQIENEIEKLQNDWKKFSEYKYSFIGTSNFTIEKRTIQKIINAQITILKESDCTSDYVELREYVKFRWSYLDDTTLSFILRAVDFLEGNIDSLTE